MNSLTAKIIPSMLFTQDLPQWSIVNHATNWQWQILNMSMDQPQKLGVLSCYLSSVQECVVFVLTLAKISNIHAASVELMLVSISQLFADIISIILSVILILFNINNNLIKINGMYTCENQRSLHFHIWYIFFEQHHNFPQLDNLHKTEFYNSNIVEDSKQRNVFHSRMVLKLGNFIHLLKFKLARRIQKMFLGSLKSVQQL